jgi:drug/metabolite transporter (DMT)-like permease
MTVPTLGHHDHSLDIGGRDRHVTHAMAIPAALVTPLAIAAWYGCNIGVILLNKYVLSFYHFKYPIFLTLLHMLSCTLFSNATVTIGLMKKQNVKSASHLRRIAFLAVVFCGSVVLGNVSLRFLPVSFNQAIGATTPFFTAVLSFLILGVVETRGTYITLIPVVVGIIIASGFEPSFHMMGFLACMGGTGARALKSVLQSALLSNPEDKLDSMNLLRYMGPVACVVLLPMTIIMEDNAFMRAYEIAQDYPSFYFALFVNCMLAFFVNLTNFLVTRYTSALTLQVLGNAKGLVAVGISILLFRNPVSAIALGGYGVTICGVIAYSEAKKAAKRQAEKSNKSDSF